MFHVVLFEPQIPPNTGNAIRLCANTGARLHLIKPLGFRLDAKTVERSGLDYAQIADVRVHDNFDRCLETLGGSRLFAVETGSARCYADIEYRDTDAFLFGAETHGLPAALRDRILAPMWVGIPMRPGNRSLNLSNSVAVVVYEAWRQIHFNPNL